MINYCNWHYNKRWWKWWENWNVWECDGIEWWEVVKHDLSKGVGEMFENCSGNFVPFITQSSKPKSTSCWIVGSHYLIISRQKKILIHSAVGVFDNKIIFHSVICHSHHRQTIISYSSNTIISNSFSFTLHCSEGWNSEEKEKSKEEDKSDIKLGKCCFFIKAS